MAARRDLSRRWSPDRVAERCADAEVAALDAALAFEDQVGGTELGGLRLGFDFTARVSLPPPRAPVTWRVAVGIAPADTILWMDRAGRIHQDPDVEFCLPIARTWHEYVALYLNNPGIVFPGGGFHLYVAAVRGLDAETLARALGVPVGGMAFGDAPAVWDDDATAIYADANAIETRPDDGATFSSNDLEALARALTLTSAAGARGSTPSNRPTPHPVTTATSSRGRGFDSDTPAARA